jgi:hypothetical protein
MTKGELANRILKLIGVNTRFSEADPQEVQDTLYNLEDWMLAHNAIGRRLGWVKSDGTPDPDEQSGLPDWAVMGVVNNVALYIAPYFEKQPNQMLQRNAQVGMQTILARTVEYQDVQYPVRFPRGYANGGPWGWKFYYPENRVVTGGDYLTDEGDDPVTTP